MRVSRISCVRIDAHEFYQDPEFVAWLNGARKGAIATWHRGGNPGDFSDIFMTWDSGEGSNSDMPEKIWKEISTQVEQRGIEYCVVWITNLPL